MRKSGHVGNSDEEALSEFRRAVADARPLSNRGRVYIEPPRPAAIARQRQLDENAALHDSLHTSPSIDLWLEGGDEPTFLRSGLPRSVLRDLRRGRWVKQGEIDLHGANRQQAHQMLSAFLVGALKRELRCLRVIHGKGLRSPGREPVLKRYVQAWLIRHSEVLAYCQARGSEGGSGALVVLLRASR